MDGEKVTKIRKHLGLNQIQFAQLFGVHQMTVSRWERSELHPSPYQHALMVEFEKAAKDKATKELIVSVLIGAGVMAALLLLLQKAKGR